MVGNQPFDWSSLGMAGVTGAASSGMGFVPALLINTGGTLAGSGIRGENPNFSMGGAAVGTLIGYPVGSQIEKPLNNLINPWYRQQWKDVRMGMSTYIPKSPVPSWFAGVGSGGIQETSGGTARTAMEKKK